ncbi:hypothetical protein RJ639_027331 [Escallonia herrerae]|uniref:Integrase catalytic domain-containing protein n=1 Tax=Escallonia herrerae TaxID=1293975 RepID=A0AA89BF80_9ASTE|nr:hypothetical protein RJ639_027331 [Escallonia herrerae]
MGSRTVTASMVSRAAPCTRLAQRPRAHPAQRPCALPTCAHAPSQVLQIVGICWWTLLTSGKSSVTHGFLCAIKGHCVSGGIRAAVAQGTVASSKKILWDSLLRKTMASTKERIDALEAQIRDMIKSDPDAPGILKQFSLRLDNLEVNLEATDNARYAENMEWEGRFQELQDRVEHHARHVEDAKLWWRKKYAEIEDGSCIINTWDILKRELKSQFFPENTAFNVRKALLECKHTCSVREYCQAFSALMLDISDMSAVDRLFFFMEGLKPWAHTELNRRRVNNLNEAIIAVGNPEESLTEEKPKDMPPKKKNDIPGKDLMYVDIKVNEKAIRAMVDTGATHNYISSTEVESLGLTLEKGYGRVKAINSAAQPVAGIARSGQIRMDSAKVQVIQEWQPPTNVSELRSFLGLTNYYKKSNVWEWSKECQLVFSAMKQAMSKDPVLALPDVSKSFEVHTDASDFALGGVLMQECHPVAYESRKLNEAERRYTTHEKELLAVVHCLRIWRHYLARWQELLAEFNFMLEYRAGSTNRVADILSRRAELDQVALMAMNAIVRADSRVAINIGKKIKKAFTRDPVAQQLLKLIESGKTRQFWQEDGLLMTKGRRYVVKYWGMPQDIVSDRDSRFTGNFWIELFKLFGSQLSMSSSYHPESDGQTERFNSMLEEYLRHFVSATQKNWVKLLDVAQLCFNSRKSSSTGKSAFEIVNGQQPLLPHTVNVPNAEKSPRAISFSEEWRQNIDLAHSYLEKAARRMKKHADKNRISQEFNVGDKVMVKLLPQDRKFLRGRDSRLLQKYEGPLTIVKKIGKMAYKVDPPHWWSRQLHPIFHVSMLKPFYEDTADPSRGQIKRQGLKPKAAGKHFE